MLEIWKTQVRPLTGRKLRKVYVYVPDEAMENPGARFPVLYMFDGHNVFLDSEATYGKSWGMKDYMDKSETQMIIAAVECSHAPDGGRLAEYSPYTFEAPEFGKIRGRGRSTMEWLVHEFRPMINENYPTLPGRKHTFIAGSSMGGLMSLYAILKYNRYFSRAAALSPSIWFSTEKLERMIMTSRLRPDTIVYMDYGSREMKFHPNMEWQFASVTAMLLEKNVMLESRIVPWGDHCEACWERQIPVFMNTLLYNGYY